MRRKQRVIELGCGTGVVGLVAATLGANVLLTDLGIYLGPIRENIEANKDVVSGEALAEELDWVVDVSENLRSSADIVIVSDCIYYEMSLEPLVKVIKSIVHAKSTIILSCEKRHEKVDLYETFFHLIKDSFQAEVKREFVLDNGNIVYLMNMSPDRKH
eukprot:GFUD01068565.1.p1 GENE.GFUD01068565.1~~GFUD01068565.1.p1  ORF type:complete len:159 (+),score=30.32 GFUD01068565.1:120-596(+)